MSSNDSQIPLTIVEPPRHALEIRARELWQYRDLFITLAWRDIQVRYKQTLLGAAWALLQPLTAMVVFTLVFSRMAKLPTGETSPPLFYYAALLAWTFFSQTVSGASQSLIEGSRLITKVYFPRIMIPASVLGYTSLNLLVASLLLLVLLPVYGASLSLQLLYLPLILLGLAFTAMGVGILIAALTVKFRDFRYVVPFLLQIWMFATPVVYPLRMIPEAWRFFAALNPMTGMVHGMRVCLLGSAPDLTVIGVSALTGTLVCLYAVAYFRRVEDEMADIL